MKKSPRPSCNPWISLSLRPLYPRDCHPPACLHPTERRPTGRHAPAGMPPSPSKALPTLPLPGSPHPHRRRCPCRPRCQHKAHRYRPAASLSDGRWNSGNHYGHEWLKRQGDSSRLKGTKASSQHGQHRLVWSARAQEKARKRNASWNKQGCPKCRRATCCEQRFEPVPPLV